VGKTSTGPAQDRGVAPWWRYPGTCPSHRQTHRHTQTDRQTDIHRQTDRQTDIHRQTDTKTHTDRQTDSSHVKTSYATLIVSLNLLLVLPMRYMLHSGTKDTQDVRPHDSI